MVYVYLEGRVGNNMSQIAAAATLARRLGTDYAAYISDYMCPIPDNCPLREYLIPYRKTIFRKVPFVDNYPENCRKIVETTGWNVTQWSQLDISADEDVLLMGYFQVSTLIDRDICQKLFAIPDDLRTTLTHRYAITPDTGTIVVRRCHYMFLPQYFAICGERYYRSAMAKLEKEYGVKRWLIISDDEQWCAETFRGEKYVIVEEPPLEDLYLNTLVKYLVISNSSFAWWGGYLNAFADQRVIFPTPWFGISFRKKEPALQMDYGSMPNWLAMKNSNPYQRFRGIVYYIRDVVKIIVKRLIKK